MTADVHCPECGALTRVEQQDDGDVVLVCADDEGCLSVVVAVLSRRAEPMTKPDLDGYSGYAR